MATGIEMDVLLETHEEKQDDVWIIKDRSVLAVLHVHSPLTQTDLDFSPRPVVKREENSDENR
jgi:hypothetical protein